MLPNKKTIKSIKYRVRLSYRNEFIFTSAKTASVFLTYCIEHVIDADDIENFTIETVVEYEEEPEEEVFIAAEVPFPEENNGGNE